MARPRVFISSTYYDLRHVRASLERFVEELGFEAVLSEKGDIAFSPDKPLDDSCYREVGSCDILVLVVGGRYGSPSSDERGALSGGFYERYNSITKGEYRTAAAHGIPTYILVDAEVLAEYQTYLRNKQNQDVKYAHVDSVNVFELLEEILAQRANNPVHQFSRYGEIEAWLRDQWAGLFKQLLGQLGHSQQLSSLAGQVADLGEISTTLRRYLEELVESSLPNNGTRIVKAESERLEEAKRKKDLRENGFVDHMVIRARVPEEIAIQSVSKGSNLSEFLEYLHKSAPGADIDNDVEGTLDIFGAARKELNAARQLVGAPQFVWEREAEVP